MSAPAIDILVHCRHSEILASAHAGRGAAASAAVPWKPESTSGRERPLSLSILWESGPCSDLEIMSFLEFLNPLKRVNSMEYLHETCHLSKSYN